MARSALPADVVPGGVVLEVNQRNYGTRWLLAEGSPQLLFTENETNYPRIYGSLAPSPYVKDAFHEYLVHRNADAVNPAGTGTKAAALYHAGLAPGASATFRLRFTDVSLENLPQNMAPLGPSYENIFDTRKAEADAFYSARGPRNLSPDARTVMRQAFSGLLWSKQYYHYDVKTWLEGDPAMPPPPPERKSGRNHGWRHLYNEDVLNMPDNWEYPWYAAWDLAFHTIPLAMIDPDSAKDQLILLLREWYMHPNGQLPAYEWAFGDVNPSVHAWAAWRVYKIEGRIHHKSDRNFLERVFHKLMINFTWWVNRKDPSGMNIFEGGFLGLDNIGVFDRSAPLPTGGHLEQSDGTSWMGMFCLN
ncbi:MAG: MGH1-like glycoside hydrolase domain-containing protein, partial [Bryobacteraceae bacterium]